MKNKSESEKEDKNLLKDKSFEFALRMIKLYQYLVNEKKEFVLSKQLLRSGTSVGAMIREAQNAESKMDFIHKFSVAQKECDETIYWLELLVKSEYITEKEFLSVFLEADAILKMLKSSILTTEANQNLKAIK